MSDESGSMKEIVVKEALAAAAGSPEMRKAGRAVGSAIATVAQTIDHALLPLAAVNFGIQKARDYFNEKFAHEFKDKTRDIPAENLTDPKPSVAGPALQGLSFSLDEPDLKELYLNLLRTAVDNRVSQLAHPAFVEIIRQMTSEEARLVQPLLKINHYVPIARGQVKVGSNIQGPNPIIFRTFELLTKKVIEIDNFESMVNNWVRLGLIDIDFSIWLTDESQYDWVKSHPTFQKLSDSRVKGEPDFEKGVCRPTPLGTNFARAVGILQ